MSLDIPDTVEGWTLDVVKELLRDNAQEGLLFDFKAAIERSNAESIVRTTAAFANTIGGFIVFGIQDRNAESDPDKRLGGIAPSSENIKRFNDQIKDKVIPVPYYTPKMPSISLPNDNVLEVIHVQRTQKGVCAVPHRSDKDAFKFYKRTESGSDEPMSPEEIRYRFQDVETARKKLRLLQVQLQQAKQRFARFQKLRDASGARSITTLDEAGLTNTIADTYVILYDHGDLVDYLHSILDFENGANNMAGSFLTYVSIPMINRDAFLHEHNEHLSQLAAMAIPVIDKSLLLLHDRFDLPHVG